MNRRIEPEALTVAYIALGAREALKGLREGEYEEVTGSAAGLGGELDVIGDAINHALAMDIAADDVEEFGGVFLYEVAEPFGRDYILTLAKGERPNVRQMIADLIASAS